MELMEISLDTYKKSKYSNLIIITHSQIYLSVSIFRFTMAGVNMELMVIWKPIMNFYSQIHHVITINL